MSQYLKEPFPVRVMKWFAQYLVGFTWIWQHIFYPIGIRILRVYKWFANLYMSMWNRVVYDSNGMFSRFRAAMAIIATFVFCYLIPALLWFSLHVGMYALTHKHEVIYLTNSQEIDSENDIHSIKGCESLPCSNENSVYFRVSPTTFSQVYSIATEGTLFYADLVASVVAPGVNKCEVDSYGIRIKTLMRKGDLYPWMLNAVCMPMGSMGSN